MTVHKMQKTLTHNIPNDLISDILLALPVKALMRFRCVCKSWNYLITSSGFISMNLHHATIDSYRNCNKVIFSSGHSFKSLDYKAATAKAEKLDFPLKAPDGLDVLGSCNGLLCIAIHNRAIVLWNPSIRKYKEIPSTLSSRKLSIKYGFGYDSTIDDYKVVKVLCGNWKVKDEQVEIYTLKSNSWTSVENTPPLARLQEACPAGTFVNGALYWIVYATPTIPDGKFHKIYRFDLRDDTCILIPLPRDVHKFYPDLILGDFGGSLCMFERDKYGIKMWTLKENNYERSWNKLRTISRLEEMPYRGCLVHVCSTKNGEILLKSLESMVKDKYYLYSLKEKGKFRELENCGIQVWDYSQAITYVESLVSPNSNGVQSFGVREEEKSVASISK